MSTTSQTAQLESRASQGGSLTGRLGDWSLVVAVNNERVLERTLLASPVIDSRCQVITKRGFLSAGKAYDAAIAEAKHEIVVFAHQDVYLPEGWLSDLERALAYLAVHDPNWAVLGSFGVAKSEGKLKTGHCYSTGLKRILGEPFPTPIETESLDELLLVVRRSSGLSFDEKLPSFHLYGTDICLQAAAQKMNSYIVSAFCIHNANGIKYLPLDFWRAYLYLRRKWWHKLPLTTCCTTVTKWCSPVVRRVAVDLKHLLLPEDVGTRCEDIDRLYRMAARNTNEERP